MNHLVIGIASIAYSLAYDIFFGSILRLYYYIDPAVSIQYTLIGGIFLYPVLNMIYTLSLPTGLRKLFIYTMAWIALMVGFEYASLAFKTIVFTGWRIFPWSYITYIVTYTWIYFLNRLLVKAIKNKA